MTPDLLSHSLTLAISTHTLRKEGDGSTQPCSRFAQLFQPTPSARRVTMTAGLILFAIKISTHTLRKEGDAIILMLFRIVHIFQPTPSARRVT